MNGHRRRRVVVGVSGSPASLAALRFAVDEASLRGDALQVITVNTPQPTLRAPYAKAEPAAPPPDIVDPELVEHAVAALGDTVDLVYEQRVGSSPAALIAAAEGADLLVVGRTTEEAFLGPTARACVTQAPCPVAVVSP